MFTAPTRQHESLQHTDREVIFPGRSRVDHELGVDDVSEVVTAYDTRRPSGSPYLRLTRIYSQFTVRYLVCMYSALFCSRSNGCAVPLYHSCHTNMYQVCTRTYVGRRIGLAVTACGIWLRPPTIVLRRYEIVDVGLPVTKRVMSYEPDIVKVRRLI